MVEVYSGIIDNHDAGKTYHIVALIDVTGREAAQRGSLNARLRDKDMLLKELQHRVKNNLQLITALIRLEARSQRGRSGQSRTTNRTHRGAWGAFRQADYLPRNSAIPSGLC